MYLDETKGSLETICMQTGIWELADAVNVKDIMVVRHSQKEKKNHSVVIRCTIRICWHKNGLYFCHHCDTQELTLNKKETRARVVMTRP